MSGIYALFVSFGRCLKSTVMFLLIYSFSQSIKVNTHKTGSEIHMHINRNIINNLSNDL